MRIISWNVNGIRAVTNKWELQNLIDTYDPDVIFLQEIKAWHDKISDTLKKPDPYRAYYKPAEKAGYAGTGAWIHARIFDAYDVEFCSSFPGDPTANEGRVAHLQLKMKNEQWIIQSAKQNTEADHPTIFDMFGIYFPNGGKSEQAWQDKLVFYREFGNYMDSLRSLEHAVLWGWDLNCAHHEIDLARPKANDGKIGFHPLERAWLDGRVADGWADIFRVKNPETRDVYSWWDVITRSRATNVGWRIDAWWGSDFFKNASVNYLTDHLGSDHCPIAIEIDI